MKSWWIISLIVRATGVARDGVDRQSVTQGRAAEGGDLGPDQSRRERRIHADAR